jgi:hypothetical protein
MSYEPVDIDDTTEEETRVNAITWTPEHEGILIEWADKAMCYRWLHSKSNMLYSRLNAWYTIPVIIISTITGTANFAQERVPIEYQGYFSMAVGTFSLVAGIITTVQQFLKITQLNEAHRVSSIAWDKFYRNIKIEIAKHPAERMEVTQMIKMSKEEYDRLMETSPNIPEKIIAEFKTSFNKNESFGKIIKPEICDILIPTNEQRNPWYNEENRTKEANLFLKNKVLKQNKLSKTNANNNKIVTDFINTFKQLNNRDPMESEIVDNLKDKLDTEQIKQIFYGVNTLSLQINTNAEDESYGLNMV